MSTKNPEFFQYHDIIPYIWLSLVFLGPEFIYSLGKMKSINQSLINIFFLENIIY